MARSNIERGEVNIFSDRLLNYSQEGHPIGWEGFFIQLMFTKHGGDLSEARLPHGHFTDRALPKGDEPVCPR